MSKERTADDIVAELEKLSNGEVIDEVEEVVEAEEEVVDTEEDEEEVAEETDELEEVAEESDEPEETEEPEEETTDEEEKPDNKAFARMRREKKRLERELAKEREAKEKESAKSLSETVEKLARAWESGDGNEGALVAKIRKASTQELSAAYDDALTGKYGDQSNDVIKLIERTMPMAQQREVRESETAKQNQQRLLDEYNAEIEEAKQDYPELADPESDGGKFMQKFNADLIGYDSKTGTFNGALSSKLAAHLESHPNDHYQLAYAVYSSNSNNSVKAVESKEIAKANKKVATLEAEIRKLKGLEDPSARKRTTKKGDTAEDIKQKLIELSRK